MTTLFILLFSAIIYYPDISGKVLFTMSIKNKNLIKEQLLSERDFIENCRFDYTRRETKLDIKSEFLRAAEKDKFLKPLLKLKQTVPQEDGSQKEMVINYYSPHQIFIVAALAKNLVIDGQLWEKSNIDFHKEQGHRYVHWGWNGHAFIVSIGTKVEPYSQHLKVTEALHNFLLLLHSFKQDNFLRYDKRRMFSLAPSLSFDLSPLKTDGELLLKKYGLNLTKLNFLRFNVAQLASTIDPLSHWYFYIKRHPRWRKDLFSGEALLAQEIYDVYDLITEVVEAVYKPPAKNLFELLYGERNIYPYLMPRTEYVSGTDVMSMRAAIQKFKEWMKQNNNKQFVKQQTLEQLTEFEKELKQYEEKYGARGYISNGVREVEYEEKLKVEDLNEKTKSYVLQIVKQAQEEIKNSKRQFLSLSDDEELEEKVKKKEITLEEAKKQDYEIFLKFEIANGIDNRLMELKRKLWAILNTVQEPITEKAGLAWDQANNFGNHFYFTKREELNKLSREEQHKLYQKEYDKAYKEAQNWSKKRDEFGRIEELMNLLFCKICRQKPVLLHQTHNEQQLSNEAICDDCIASAKEPRLINGGEWKCFNCGRMLYKFAHNNRLNDLVKNTASVDITLEYGRMQIQITCPNPNCKQVNMRIADWGWQP